jgi:uncharacterized membrane protein YeaQ/YmgE (transglycosylase-associated protein family)
MGFIAWIVVGLIADWLAGKVLRAGGYGVVVDILGLLGGVVGGGSSECWGFGRAAESSARSLSPSWAP